MGIWNRKAKPVFLLILTVFILMNVIACGKNPAAPQSASQNVPAGIGATPESGIAETSVVSPNGHSESITSANGITYVGSDNETLYAFRSKNGQLLWQHTLDGLVSIYAIANGAIYVVSGANYDVVYTLNAVNGALLWHHQIDSSIFGMVVVNSVVYDNTNSYGNNRASVYALQGTNGSLLWRYTAEIDIPTTITVSSSGIVYVPVYGMRDSSAFIYALQASNGHFLWSLRLDEPLGGQPVEVNGIVYIASSSGTIYALHANTGIPLWRFTRYTGTSTIAVSPTIVNGSIYIAAEDSIYALRASDGTLLWRYPKGTSSNFSDTGQPVVANGTVYVGDIDGPIYALQANNGRLLWQQQIGKSVFGPLSVADGLVIASTQSNYEFALRGSNGSLLWQHPVDTFSTLSDQLPPHVVANGMVFSGTQDGTVNVVRTSDGSLLWHYTIKERAVPLEPVYSAAITFTSSVSYTQALRTVTDLGLHTFKACAWSIWQPESDPASLPYLLVISTPNAAPLWLNRLKAMPEIKSVQSNPVFNCPMMTASPLPPGANTFLPEDKPGTYVRVTFSGSLNSYEAALNAINTQGFRLANPCYERARAAGAKPTWNTMGQETSFAQTHTLLLATTVFNAIRWESQLHALAGVVKIEAPFQETC